LGDEEGITLKKTVLFDLHEAAGAKMAPFGGFIMPIQYDGIIKEHQQTRQRVSLFDTCHMGEFYISGSSAALDLEKVLSCKVSDLPTGHCRYGFLCNEQGGVIDDQVLYRIGDNSFMMVVNAGTQDTDYNWIKSHCSSQTMVENRSEKTAKIDIQGPMAPQMVQKLCDKSIEGLIFYRFMFNHFQGNEIILSRTGYTGEIGFEIYCSTDLAHRIWNAFCEEGARPAGLGARDTLRLEMGFPLYGHELNSRRNAAESGFTRAIAADKSFIGSSIVLSAEHSKQQLVGIALDGRSAGREENPVLDSHGSTIGTVTSGCFAPSLGSAIALAYINKAHCAAGTPVVIQSGKRSLKGVVTTLPFYTEATGRKKISRFL